MAQGFSVRFLELGISLNASSAPLLTSTQVLSREFHSAMKDAIHTTVRAGRNQGDGCKPGTSIPGTATHGMEEPSRPQRSDCMVLPPLHEILADADEEEIRKCIPEMTPEEINELLAESAAAQALGTLASADGHEGSSERCCHHRLSCSGSTTFH
mmetsp:Transcript_77220/g.186915  ORF Transcript_77220/g.186915 Transcript_77220/m.186915 type:complete len:155 (-) Transcript_77220:125-589(-)